MEDVQETIKALELFTRSIKRAKESGYRVAAAAIPAQETAIWALKKQVPQAPTKGRNPVGAEYWFCPQCGAIAVPAGEEELLTDYCPACGQRLSWEVD